MCFVVGEMNCMDFGENFVLRHSQVMKNFQVRNWEVRLDNLNELKVCSSDDGS